MKLDVILSQKTLETSIINQDIILRANNYNSIELIVRDEELAFVDLTGSTVTLMIKEKSSDTDASAKLDIDVTSHSNPTAGETEINMTPAQTLNLLGNYIYQISISFSTNEVYTLAEGTVCFRKNIIGITE